MKSVVLIVFFIFTSLTTIKAQEKNFPVYDNQALVRPARLPLFKAEDFKINPGRLTLYPEGFLYANNTVLEKLFDFFLNDPKAYSMWQKEAKNTARVLNQWDFDRRGFGGDRYIYRMPQLENLSLVYLLSGHKELGEFIRGHILMMTNLPYEFWLHSELRGYNSEHPIGGLETSSLCTTLTMAISATFNLYSPTEKKQIDEALYQKGLVPCLNWLDHAGTNNWTAVVSTGAYVAAKYFGDQPALEKALGVMKKYLDGSIETDGSYGEGLGYFDYPIRSLLPAILVMSPEERIEYFSPSGLKNSASWKVYPYLFAKRPDGQVAQTVLHFGDNSSLGDNSFIGPTQQKVNLILAALYQDTLASWLLTRFGGELDIKERLLLYSIPNGLPNPKSPKQAQLPLVKTFSGGDNYIRSSWEENGVVLSMWSGNGSRCNFSHQRPEMGSVCMGAFGEYMIVSSGSASYRSPLRYQWDMTTQAANTITIDEKNQLFPDKGIYKWNKVDLSDIWESGEPKAEIVQSFQGEIADILVNEMALAYHTPMKFVRRSVLFVRDPGYFVIIDKIEASEGIHKYTWRLHLNNRDGNGILRQMDNGHWHFDRPLANLDIFLFADKDIKTSIGEGYMHGPTRDYSPGGSNEGMLGSSIEIKAGNSQDDQQLTYYSVLFPKADGEDKNIPEVKFTGNELFIDNDVLILINGKCEIHKNGKVEKYQLW